MTNAAEERAGGRDPRTPHINSVDGIEGVGEVVRMIVRLFSIESDMLKLHCCPTDARCFESVFRKI